MKKTSGISLTPFASVLLSVLASSHHWLHMGIIMLLGGSAGVMATMTGMLWLRRLMILMTLVTVAVTTYRLIKHKCRHRLQAVLNWASVAVSIGFVGYTLFQIGW